MSFTLYALVAAAAPTVLSEAGNFIKGHKDIINAALKQSKPVIHEASKKLDEALHKYEIDGWSKEKKE